MEKFIPSNLLEHGISLESIGLNEIAWTKDLAVKVVFSLDEEIGILGGDVYLLKEKKIIPTYENWYCCKKEGESNKSFNKRSKKKAIEYIDLYKLNNSDDLLFVFVFNLPELQ